MRKTYKIVDENGFHARPANDLVMAANRFLDTEIFAEVRNRKATLHSILGVLSLHVQFGDQFTIIANGEQEVEATRALEEAIFNLKIGELME
ncbi:HPr family phosphocarrier protein [Peribacillus sp. NPDC096379]|uniref:HPr family phosphocarrier protein n=1 Tax=Peribacillus sp. NPDC096379 TaxID=3364393 RepID=UPI003804D269